MPKRAKKKNRYFKIIESIFLSHYKSRAKSVSFSRDDIVKMARKLNIKLPKNIGDVIYSFRYRVRLPECIRNAAPKDKEWIIRPAGTALYKFEAVSLAHIIPSGVLAEIKIPDATPGIIASYALSDEQALLAKLRYNRLVDIFTGITCYSLQNHLRTSIPGMGQIETDEIYVGIDKRGAQYAVPVQAKGHEDRLSVVQIEQDIAMCAEKYPALICRPIAAQFMTDERIALFELVLTGGQIKVASEKHYQLVESDEISDDDLATYTRTSD